jgi:(heptosyl)LPS beta-1,4-glucosyltransferase
MVHESVDTQGAPVRMLAGHLLHYTCRDYQYFLEKHVAYAHAWARERAAAGRRGSLLKAVTHATWSFLKHYVVFWGFLDGWYGWLFAKHSAQYVFNKYAALWHYGRAENATASHSQSTRRAA